MSCDRVNGVSSHFFLHSDAALSPERWFANSSGGWTLLRVQLWEFFFFFSYKLQKRVTVTMLPLFGHVTLLCGKCRFIKLREGPVQLSDHMSDTPQLRRRIPACKRQCERGFYLCHLFLHCVTAFRG